MTARFLVRSGVPDLAMGAVVDFARNPARPEFWRIPLQSNAHVPLELELLELHFCVLNCRITDNSFTSFERRPESECIADSLDLKLITQDSMEQNNVRHER